MGLFSNKPTVTQDEYKFTGNRVYIDGAYLKTEGNMGFVSIPMNKIDVVSVDFKPELSLKGPTDFTTKIKFVGCGTVLGDVSTPYATALEIQNWIMEKLPA